MKFKKIVKESRKPHMWAIDFRNMRTAVHGLLYGADRKEVQSFYNNLKDLKSEEMDGYEVEDLMNAYDSIKMIDEINFRRIGRLASGRYGIEIDDVEYWIINDVSEDLYMESTKRNNRKIVKESEDGDAPRIYVGTYAKYNDGSIGGEWVDLSQFDSYEEFVDYCRELHSDEEDPEFMVQDYEGFPSNWYHESGLPSEEEFDKINEFYMMDDSKKGAYEVFVNYTGLDSIEDFEEAYEGKFNSPEDFGYYAVDVWGIPENPEYYFDYESFGRDLTMDWHQGDPEETDAEGEPEDPDYYYDSEGYQQMEYGSDREVGEQYIDDIGIDQLGQNTFNNYFDYEEYGRTLLINDFWEDAGYVFREI